MLKFPDFQNLLEVLRIDPLPMYIVVGVVDVVISKVVVMVVDIVDVFSIILRGVFVYTEII